MTYVATWGIPQVFYDAPPPPPHDNDHKAENDDDDDGDDKATRAVSSCSPRLVGPSQLGRETSAMHQLITVSDHCALYTPLGTLHPTVHCIAIQTLLELTNLGLVHLVTSTSCTAIKHSAPLERHNSVQRNFASVEIDVQCAVWRALAGSAQCASV